MGFVIYKVALDMFFPPSTSTLVDWGSSVSMTTLRAVRPGSITGRGGEGISFFATASTPALRSTQPPTKWVLGRVGLCPRVKRPERGAGHLPLVPSLKYTSIPPYVFMALCLSTRYVL
jgi:hypothetical protein